MVWFLFLGRCFVCLLFWREEKVDLRYHFCCCRWNTPFFSGGFFWDFRDTRRASPALFSSFGIRLRRVWGRRRWKLFYFFYERWWWRWQRHVHEDDLMLTMKYEWRQRASSFLCGCSCCRKDVNSFFFFSFVLSPFKLCLFHLSRFFSDPTLPFFFPAATALSQSTTLVCT